MNKKKKIETMVDLPISQAKVAERLGLSRQGLNEWLKRNGYKIVSKKIKLVKK